jgi:hypothetical protein
MMAKHFLHISFNFADKDAKINTLKPVFNKATDWFRYAPNCWLVWTGRSAEKWYELLRPHISDKDSMLIVRLDISERQGWLSESAWEWLNEERK